MDKRLEAVKLAREINNRANRLPKMSRAARDRETEELLEKVRASDKEQVNAGLRACEIATKNEPIVSAFVSPKRKT